MDATVRLSCVPEKSAAVVALRWSNSADYDNDPATDYYVNAGWADVNGAWPESVGQPAELLHLKATTAADFSGTQLNITIASTDVNYVASSDTLLLTSTIGD